MYVQEHGIATQQDLKNQVLSSKTELEKLQAQLTRHTADRKRINSQIHYTGQYFANKDVYSQFVKSTFKGKFRKEHASEIQAYEEARDWLKSFYPDGNMTGMKMLKEQRSKLQAKIDSEKKSIQSLKEKLKELETADQNVDGILQMQIPEPTQQKTKSKEYER